MIINEQLAKGEMWKKNWRRNIKVCEQKLFKNWKEKTSKICCLQQKKISVDKHIADKLELITWTLVECCGWVFCLILICWGGGGGVRLFSLWGLSGLFSSWLEFNSQTQHQ